MFKFGVRAFVFSAFAMSCATSSNPPAAHPHAETKPAAAPMAPPPAAETAPAAVMDKPKLQPGHCQDSFDCVDTVGFPAPGYRWSCETGKCARAKLPILGGEQPATAEEDPTAVAGKAKTKASKKKKQAN